MELSQKILCQFRFCGLIYSMRKKFWITEMELSQKILCQFRFCGLIFLPPF
jgi:hypothetical protein